jgi:hypothetical protein
VIEGWTVDEVRLTKSAVVAREFASRTGSIELNAADTADFILGHVPSPGSDGMPCLDGDLHRCCWSAKDNLGNSMPAQAPSEVDMKWENRGSGRSGFVNI